MGFFDSIFGGGDMEDPSAAASSYFEQIPGRVTPYYQPFIDSGKQAADVANPIYGRMAQDPSEFLNAIMRNYSPSEGYKFKEKNLTQAAQNAAAQGGYAGTPYSQLEQTDLVNGLLGGDMQQFLQNILGIQGGGLQGQENRIGRGYEASGGLANILGGNLAQQGNLAYQGAAQRNQNSLDRRGQNFNFLNGLISSGTKAYGAGMFGAPGAGGAGGTAGGFF